ncbi:MAG: hypothetical protein AAF518_05020 [Spirochaetota bacterium]
MKKENSLRIIEHRISFLRKLVIKNKKILDKISLLRIISFFFLPAYATSYYLLALQNKYYLLVLPVVFFVFVYLVLHFRNRKEFLVKIHSYISLLQREKARAECNVSKLFRGDPTFVCEESHYYRDLDLFGEYGLFTYLDTTETQRGEELFCANLLQKNPLQTSEILHRQNLIQTFSNNRYLALKALRLLKEGSEGRLHKIDLGILHRIGRYFFADKRWLRFTFPMLPFILWTSALLSLLLDLPSLASSLVFLQLLLHLYYRKKILQYVKPYRILFDTSEQIYKLLVYLRGIHFFAETQVKEIHQAFKDLKKLANRFSFIDAPAFHIFLNVTVLWDFWQIVRLEKWLQRYTEASKVWAEKVELFDSVLPFIVLKWHNPQYEFPQVNEEFSTLTSDTMGHLLIPQNVRVDNRLNPVTSGDTVIITGSNMSGKTTYLRTIGVNVLLALCGSSVPCKGLQLPPIKILSSIKNFDSLKDGISFFYSEAKQISYIIGEVRQGQKCLVLLDEILKGTNTRERFLASKAIIRELAKYESFCFLTTHDLELTKIRTEKVAQFYHFTEQVEGNSMSFDYQLKDGVVTSSNALLILQQEGLHLDYQRD